MKENIKNILNCLQDEEAFCTTECPFHLDMRNFIEKMQRGSFNSAFKVYRNAVGFPDIVAELCSEPCKKVCPRVHTDKAIAVKLLERASIAYTLNTKPTNYNLPLKNKRIAIIGAGISGLACMLRLTIKKYEVTIYEQSNRIGGQLWKILPPNIFLADIKRQFMYEKYTLYLNTRIDSLDDLDYDAIYIATGVGGYDFGLMRSVTENSFCSSKEGIFLGGSLLGAGSIDAIAHGFYAANQIECYIKVGSMSSTDKKHQTKMQLDPAALTFMEPVLPADEIAFSEEEAKAEAIRCLRCTCDSCQRHCDLVDFYKKYPKRIKDEVIAAIDPSTLDGARVVAKRIVSSCNQCGLCKETCPESIDLGKFLLESRRELHKRGYMPWVFHDFWLSDMAFANGESAHMSCIPEEYTKSNYMFFPGCQLGASDTGYVHESYRYLLKHQPDTALMLSCCGAPAAWAGDEKLHENTLEKLRKDWILLGRPTAIFACPTCKQMFKDYLPEINGIFLYDLLLQWGIIPSKNIGGQVFSVFDPCSTRNEPTLQQTIRQLSKKAGCQLQPLPYDKQRAQCCSWGGQVSIANPLYAKHVIEKRIQQNDNLYITYCTNCRDIFVAEGKPSLHILDILFDLNDGSRMPPTITERRKNRMDLKRMILKEFWNKEMTMEQMDGHIKLVINPKLKKKLNDELLLETDALAVVEHCEKSGRKTIAPVTGHSFGYMEVGNLTFWVEYRQVEEVFELINAYSHRMKIELEEVWNGSKRDADM